MFRFIHTADIHLDSPLRSLALKEPEAAELVANATRQTFSKTIDLCLEEQVDALLISGDLYDGELKSMKTAAFVTRELRRLTEAGVKAFIIRGNHDAESRITKHLELPDGVHVFSGRAEAVTVEGADVVICGVSFAKPSAPESLVPKFKPPTTDAINIGMLHTSLGGASDHDVYAPCSVQDLIDQGYDYWALGHIHQRDVHATAPSTIVMPGIPQGRHINEAGPKSVTLGWVDGNRALHIEERHTSLAEFQRIAVDLSGAEERSDVTGRADKVLGEAFDAIRSDHLIARIEFRGATSLASWIRRDADVVMAEVKEAARRNGSILIESIASDVCPKTSEADEVKGDPIKELRELMHSEVLDRATAVEQTRAMLKDLQSKLPPELRDRFEADDDDAADLVDRYLNDGAEDVLARLETSEPLV